MTHSTGPDETAQWLNYLQPEGLVVGANVLRQRQLTPIRQTPGDTDEARDALGLPSESSAADDENFVLADAWRLFERVLDWPAKLLAGSPGGPSVPAALSRTIPEHDTLLEPDLAVLWNGEPLEEGVPVQALIMLHPTREPDGRNQFGAGEWEASPHQRLVRLLRETEVGVGILIARNTLRLVHAPRGETAGWISWPLAALGRVDGRPMLAGLKLCLGRNAFFTGAPDARLRPLLKASREAQNEVSDRLSGQVLGALHELLRGLHRAAPERIEAITQNDPHHLYEGLLTCLMRLVFLLYAEDRDLLPTSPDPQLRALWESGYSIKTLYARLLADEAVNPDTMDERRGGWGQLLAVFRLIHGGRDGWIAARGGKLFDPDIFAFLEGREEASPREGAKVLPVSDGTILRILHGLMTVDARSFSGEKIRERLSYKSLDVESIGSVYETVMGFTARRATERMIALKDEKKLPSFVGLETLLGQKPADRQKWLKEQAVKLSAKQAAAVKAATDEASLLEALGNAIDERASPKGAPFGAGMPYLQPTEERRRSGSHYTPRSLTAPIVQHALEPAFERIGAAASPEAVLSLKVLDPACGSGAFLVEACRQLGKRLEQAWDMHKAEKPTIPPDEDETTHACRLVAQKCLYGVDRNPMAVDLARLSLWLITLAREHEFSFLDHALKSGDSLVGLTRHEIEAANWDASKPGLPLFRKMIKDSVDRALAGREAIRNASDDVLMEAQAARYLRVVDASEPARIVGDAVIAAFFAADKPKAREAARVEVERAIADSLTPKWDLLKAKARAFHAEHGWRPFHWEIEFPEVFARDNPGFDAIVGNPPFLGGAKIWSALGRQYPDWLRLVHPQSGGKAVDLVAHFFRRCFGLIRTAGAVGLLATKTIAEGDTHSAGLGYICLNGGQIYYVDKDFEWPGTAAVRVSSVVLCKDGEWRSPSISKRAVANINSKLMDGVEVAAPSVLQNQYAKCFRGADTYGLGFIFADDGNEANAGTIADANIFIGADARNREIIKPYIGGDEVTTYPNQGYRRYAINFRDMSLAEARTWPTLLEIVEQKVKPSRDKIGGYAVAERRKKFWWQYGTDTPALRRETSRLAWVLAISQTTAHICFAKIAADMIFSQKLIVVTTSEVESVFAALQSRVHMLWALHWGSRQGETPVYSPPECFQTYPFPHGCETDATLESIGQTYLDYRAQLMIDANEGMTKTYNRFHKREEKSPAIQRLRELHDEMDRAVLRAYGWDDLADTLRPQFLTEETEDDHTYQGRYFWPAEQRDLVLSRLLALNAARHAEEVAAGTAPASSKRRSASDDVESDDDQDSLDL